MCLIGVVTLRRFQVTARSSITIFITMYSCCTAWYSLTRCDLCDLCDLCPLQIHYFALISQCTGEDWDEAPLVLSTSQPSIGGSPPDLGTKKLSFQIETQQQFRYPQSYGFNDVPSSRSQQQQVVFRGVPTGIMMCRFNDESSSSQAPQLTVPTAEVCVL